VILAIAFINNPSGSPNDKKNVHQHQQELSFVNVVWEEKPVSNNTIIKSKARVWATTPESLLEQKMHLSSGDQVNKIEKVIDTIVVKKKLLDDSRALANEVEAAMLQSTEVRGFAVRHTVNSNLKPPIESKVRTWKTTPESLLERKTHFSSGDQLNKIEKAIDTIVAKRRLPDHSHASVNKAEQDMRDTVEVRSSVPKNTVTGIIKLPIGRPRIEEKKTQLTSLKPSDNIVKKPLKNTSSLTKNSENPNPKVKNVEIKDYRIAGRKNKAPSSKFRTSDILKSLGSKSKGYDSPPSLTTQTNSRTKLKPLVSMPPGKFEASKQSNVCQNKQLVVKKQVASPETRANIDYILRRSSNYQISPMTVDKLLSQSNSGRNNNSRVNPSLTMEHLLEISNRQEVSFICVD
jgi:hypothetical protein